jgi:hypothetical protein
MKTVLIFVLSSHKPPYDKMIETAKETWDRDALPGTLTWYYCGNPTNNDAARVVSFDSGEEDYKTIGRKNLLAFPWALNLPWDFMARVNASCYVHKRRLLDHVQTLPTHGLIRGICSPPTPACGVNRNFMWGGGQFIISRDVIEAFVAKQDHWRHDVMEDVAMSELAQDLGFTLDCNGLVATVHRDGAQSQLLTYNAPEEEQFFFRCKYDPDRAVDANTMRNLKATLPP